MAALKEETTGNADSLDWVAIPRHFDCPLHVCGDGVSTHITAELTAEYVINPKISSVLIDGDFADRISNAVIAAFENAAKKAKNGGAK